MAPEKTFSIKSKYETHHKYVYGLKKCILASCRMIRDVHGVISIITNISSFGGCLATLFALKETDFVVLS